MTSATPSGHNKERVDFHPSLKTTTSLAAPDPRARTREMNRKPNGREFLHLKQWRSVTRAFIVALALVTSAQNADATSHVLPNGGSVLGSLLIIGAEDDYEFTAGLGDHIELRMASSDPLYPEIELRDPKSPAKRPPMIACWKPPEPSR